MKQVVKPAITDKPKEKEPEIAIIESFAALTYDQKVLAMRHIKREFASSTDEQMKGAEIRNCFLKEVREEFFANW